jgi:ribonuclease BN (tRNA processing enzyme)
MHADLIPLGTSSAHGTGIQRFCSYLLTIAARGRIYRILLDCGSSRILDPNWVDLLTLDAIFITHLHGDHTFFLGELIKRMRQRGRQTPVAIIAHRMAIPWLNFGIKLWNRMHLPEFIRFYPVCPEIDDPNYQYSFPWLNPPISMPIPRSLRWGVSGILAKFERVPALTVSQSHKFPRIRAKTDIGRELCGRGIRRAEAFKIHDFYHALHPTPFPDPYSNRMRPRYIPPIPDTAEEAGCNITFRAIRATHPMWTLAFRFHIAAQNQSLDLIFSPDHCCNRPHPMIKFASGAEYWLLDSTYIHPEPNPGTFQPGFHSSLPHSLLYCRAARVKTYLIGHYCWDRAGKSYAEAIRMLRRIRSPRFPGQIQLTEECKPLRLEFTAQNKIN